MEKGNFFNRWMGSYKWHLSCKLCKVRQVCWAYPQPDLCSIFSARLLQNWVVFRPKKSYQHDFLWPAEIFFAHNCIICNHSIGLLCLPCTNFWIKSLASLQMAMITNYHFCQVPVQWLLMPFGHMSHVKYGSWHVSSTPWGMSTTYKR